jgi:DNA-binding GntR family transcriptional regulator
MTRLLPRSTSPERVALRKIDVRKSRTEEVVEILRASIVSGQLERGSMHSVATLADELGVSRTPVREALIKLASRGMVSFERNRGVRILEMSTTDLEEIFERRRLLEAPAARNAVAKATPAGIRALRRIIDAQARASASGDEQELWELDRAFHRGLLQMGGNRRLVDYVDHLRDVIAVRSMVSARSARQERGGAVDHGAILERLEQGDVDGLGAAVLGHLDGALLMLREPHK